MSKSNKNIRKDVKKILKHEVGTAAGKAHRDKGRERDARRAIKVVHKQAKTGPLTAGTSEMFHRAFTDRDAARLAWMLTVCDPFGKHHWAIPPIISPGIPLSLPRIYRVTMRGFAYANAEGRVFIGANADMWLPDPGRATLTNPQPAYGFLGNNPSNGVGFARGAPVHYTIATYAGCTAATPAIVGSTPKSYPGPQVTACTGLGFCYLPNAFINTQLPGDPTSQDAFQRCTNISVGLRVRPTAPASGALVPQGVLMMTQQILGDTVQTNAAAASTSSAIGGADVYGYLAGLHGTGANSELTNDMIARQEWDVMEWPHDKQGKGSASWLSAAAIPNQSCSLGAYAPKVTGDAIVGYPQLACVGAGMLEGQAVEFEASYTYAFYGAVSYEVNAHKGQAAVPGSDLADTAASAVPHMSIGGEKSLPPSRQAVAAMVQPAVSSGDLKPSSAAKWVSSGKEVIEAATGSSIGDLIGEGLGFLGAMLM